MTNGVSKIGMSEYGAGGSVLQQSEELEKPEMSLGLEDNRNTLLWLPQATADGNGEMEFEFYTSDISSLFSIVCVAYELVGNGLGEGNKTLKVINLSIDMSRK